MTKQKRFLMVIALGITTLLPSCANSKNEELSLFGSYLSARQSGLSGDFNSSLGFWEETLKKSDNPESFIPWVMQFNLITGNVDRGYEIAQEIVDKGLTNSYARALLGIKSMQNGDFTSARQHFSTTASQPIEVITTTFLNAWMLVLNGNLEEGIKALDIMANVESLKNYRLFHIGLMRAFVDPAQNNPEIVQASKIFGPVSARSSQVFAGLLVAKGQIKEAIKLLQTSKKITRGDPVVSQLLTDLVAAEQRGEYKQGETPDREILLNDSKFQLINTAKEAISESLYTASILSASSLNETALAFLSLAQAANPEFVIAGIFQAKLYNQGKHYNLQINLLDKLASMPGMRVYAAQNKASALYFSDRKEEAINLLNDALTEDPQNSDLWLSKANLLRYSEEWKDAAVSYSQTLKYSEFSPETNWFIYFSRAIAYERSDNWKKAEKDLLTALKFQPEHPDILNYLGYTWIDRGENLRNGLAMIKKAVKLKPSSGAIVDSLGWAYYRLGRYTDSVKELEKAVQLRAFDSIISDHLGDAYWKIGRRREALYQWDHALKLEPETKEAEEKINTKIRRANRINKGLSGPQPI